MAPRGWCCSGCARPEPGRIRGARREPAGQESAAPGRQSLFARLPRRARPGGQGLWESVGAPGRPGPLSRGESGLGGGPRAGTEALSQAPGTTLGQGPLPPRGA